MRWYNTEGPCNDIVLSTRIRLARNLDGYPFSSKLNDNKANEIINNVTPILEKSGFTKIDFNKLTRPEAYSYVEKRYASHEFAEKTGPHTLMLNETCGYAVMICEEDHLRLQCIMSGLALDKAYDSISRLDDVLSESFPFAFDKELGYLTHCPTNLGTGMRASVMMFLPALTMSGRMGGITNELSKIGLTVRGIYGEGTASEGNIYQISNQITLGMSEETIIKKLKDAVNKLIDGEKELRGHISTEESPKLIDRINRAEGTLRHAFMMSSSEFISLYSDVRLGIDLGIIKSIDYKTLDGLLIDVMPASLSISNNTLKNELDRDIIRAKRIKEELKAK